MAPPVGLQVGAASRGGPDIDNDFAGARFHTWHVLHAQVTRTVKYRSAHVVPFDFTIDEEMQASD